MYQIFKLLLVFMLFIILDSCSSDDFKCPDVNSLSKKWENCNSGACMSGEIQNISAHKERTFALALSQDSTIAVTGDVTGKLLKWNIVNNPTYKEMVIETLKKSSITDILFLDENSTILIAGCNETNGIAVVFDLQREVLISSKVIAGCIMRVSYHPATSSLVFLSRGKIDGIHILITNRELILQSEKFIEDKNYSISGVSKGNIAISPDNSKVAITTSPAVLGSGFLTVFKREDLSIIYTKEFATSSWNFMPVAFSLDSESIIIGAAQVPVTENPQNILLFEANTGKIKNGFSVKGHNIASFILDNSGRFLIVGMLDNSTHFIDITDRTVKKITNAESWNISSINDMLLDMQLSKDGKKLFYVGGMCALRILDIQNVYR